MRFNLTKKYYNTILLVEIEYLKKMLNKNILKNIIIKEIINKKTKKKYKNNNNNLQLKYIKDPK